jgi:hypothetical protein
VTADSSRSQEALTRCRETLLPPRNGKRIARAGLEGAPKVERKLRGAQGPARASSLAPWCLILVGSCFADASFRKKRARRFPYPGWRLAGMRAGSPGAGRNLRAYRAAESTTTQGS